MIYQGREMLSGAPHPLITVSLQPLHPSMLGGFLESDGKAGLESHSNSHIRATLTSFWASLSLSLRFAAVAGFQSVHGVQPGAHPARGLAPPSWHRRTGTGLSDISAVTSLTQESARSHPESLFSSQKHTICSLRLAIQKLISHPE